MHRRLDESFPFSELLHQDVRPSGGLRSVAGWWASDPRTGNCTDLHLTPFMVLHTTARRGTKSP